MKCYLVCNGFSPRAEQSLRQLFGVAQALGAPVERLFWLCRTPPERAPIDNLPCTVLAGAHDQCEPFLPVLTRWAEPDTVLLFDSSATGNALAVRLAVRSGGSSLTGIQSAWMENGTLYAEKMVYSTHMIGTFRLAQGPWCVSIAPGLSAAELPEGIPGEIECVAVSEDGTEFCSVTPPEPAGGLEHADFVVTVGRGARTKQGAADCAALAKEMGAAFGVTRMAAMNGWARMEQLVGVSGVMLHPNICIASGASGAAAFYAGIEKSNHILAVNTDAAAPVCKGADVILCGDCTETLRLLAQRIKEEEAPC